MTKIDFQNYDWYFFENFQIFSSKLPQFSKFQMFPLNFSLKSRKNMWKSKISEKIPIEILKIHFRHEKLIFFFQIFFLTRYGYVVQENKCFGANKTP